MKVMDILNQDCEEASTGDVDISIDIIPPRYTPPILRSSRPEAHFDNSESTTSHRQEPSKIVRSRFSRRNKYENLTDSDCDITDGGTKPQAIFISKSENGDVLENNLQNDADKELQNFPDMNKNPLTTCRYETSSSLHLLGQENDNETPSLCSERPESPRINKRVSFRCDDFLEEIMEIPSRFESGLILPWGEDSDNSENEYRDVDVKKTDSNIRVTKSAKARSNGANFSPQVLLPRRPKTTSRILHDKCTPTKNKMIRNREKSQKISYPKTSNIAASINNFPKIKDKIAVSQDNRNKCTKTSSTNLNPLLNIKAKRLIQRNNNQKDSLEVTQMKRLHSFVYGDDVSSEINDLHVDFKKCRVGKDKNEFKSYSSDITKTSTSKEKMYAWHIANSCDLSELRTQPEIVPLWD